MFLMTAAAAILMASQSLVEASCPDNCGEDGGCVDDMCVCDNGYAGADCSFPVLVCPGARMTCFEKAKCVSYNQQDLDMEDRDWSCDCTDEFGNIDFTIDRCYEPKIESCERDIETSTFAFCINGGTCRGLVDDGDLHVGCDCPDGYEGLHCQYEEGDAPDGELLVVEERAPSSGKSKSKSKVGTISGLFIAAIVVSVVGGIGFIVYKKTIGSPGTTSSGVPSY